MDSEHLRFFDAAVRAEMSLWSDVENAVVEACGIKLGSVAVLRAIAARDDVARVQDLAEDLGITIGAVSKIVDRLESGKLVQRKPHASDGRSWLITRTARGGRTLTTAVSAMTRVLEQRLAPMVSKAQLRAMNEVMESLARAAAGS